MHPFYQLGMGPSNSCLGPTFFFNHFIERMASCLLYAFSFRFLVFSMATDTIQDVSMVTFCLWSNLDRARFLTFSLRAFLNLIGGWVTITGGFWCRDGGCCALIHYCVCSFLPNKGSRMVPKKNCRCNFCQDYVL